MLTAVAVMLLTCLPLSAAATESPFGPVSDGAPDAALTMSMLRQEIVQIPCGVCENLVDLEDVQGGPDDGTPYDEILISGGVSFAERLDDQPLSYTDYLETTHDVLDCLDTLNAPLALLVGEPLQNVFVGDAGYESNLIAGVGPTGWPAWEAVGEGALAMVLPEDASHLRFDIVGANPEDGNELWLCFYDRDAVLIDIVHIESYHDDCYAFARSGGEIDIAAVSLHNLDFYGIGFDNICFGMGTTPLEDVGLSTVKSMY